MPLVIGDAGCGVAAIGWQAVQCPDTARVKLPITIKEFFPILLGHQWTKRRVQFFCDNKAVVVIIRSRTSRQPHLMQLLRCLFLVEAHHDITDL